MAAQQVASVSSLETLVFKAVHPKEMLKFLADGWTSPIRQQYWSEFKQSPSLTEMTQLSKTLPWDHPAAHDLDFTVHKKRMQGKKIVFCFVPLRPSLSPLFYIFYRHVLDSHSFLLGSPLSLEVKSTPA